jgi:F-type H+-transporting ATPase subunit b
MRRFDAKAFALSLAVLAWPTISAAATGAAHHDGPPTSGQWFLLLFTVVNFVAFAYLLVRFTATPLKEFLRGRRRELVELMAEAQRAKAEAEQLRKEYDAKAAALEQTRRDLIAEIKAIAEDDRARMLVEARAASDRLIRDAERAARSDVERARGEIRAEAARLATELATAEVSRRLDDPARRRLVDEFLTGVPRK